MEGLNNDSIINRTEMVNDHRRIRPAMTAFMIYVAKNATEVMNPLRYQEQIRKSHSEASNEEVGQLLYDQWKQLSPTDIQVYEELSRKDQEARKQAKKGFYSC